MKLTILALSETGKKIAKTIQRLPLLAGDKLEPLHYPEAKNVPFITADLARELGSLNKGTTGVICIMPTAELLKNSGALAKWSDAFLILIDEQAQFVMSLLPGKDNVGNQVAMRLAEILEAQPVITSQEEAVPLTFTKLVKQVRGWYSKAKFDGEILDQLFLAEDKIALIQDRPYLTDVPRLTPVSSGENLQEFSAAILISMKAQVITNQKVVLVVPRRIYLGVSYPLGLSPNSLQKEFLKFCHQEKIHPFSIRKIASINRLRGDAALLDLAAWLEVLLVTYDTKLFSEENYAEAAVYTDTQKEATSSYHNHHIQFALMRPKDELE